MKEMKKVIFIIITTFISINGIAQKLERDEVDEFTKDSIQETSWEKLAGKNMSSFCANFRLKKVNGNVWFSLKLMMNNSIYSIDKGEKLIFLFDDKSTYELTNSEYTLTSKGGGAIGHGGSEGWGTQTNYLLGNDFNEQFRTKKVTKIRVYTSEGYTEKEVDKGFNDRLRKCIELLH